MTVNEARLTTPTNDDLRQTSSTEQLECKSNPHLDALD